MTIKELIEKLKQYHEDVEISAMTIGDINDSVLIQSIKD